MHEGSLVWKPFKLPTLLSNTVARTDTAVNDNDRDNDNGCQRRTVIQLFLSPIACFWIYGG
jgi:hypothetical protein